MRCRATNAPYAPSVFTHPHGWRSAGRRYARAIASTMTVSREGARGRRGAGHATHAQTSAPSAVTAATAVQVAGVGQAQNQARSEAVSRSGTPRRARAGPGSGRAGGVTVSTNGLELLQQGLRGGGALEDRGGARDLVDGLLDGLGPAAALQLPFRLHVVLVDHALAHRAQQPVADVAHAVEAREELGGGVGGGHGGVRAG